MRSIWAKSLTRAGFFGSGRSRLSRSRKHLEFETLEARLTGVNQGRKAVDDRGGHQILEIHPETRRLERLLNRLHRRRPLGWMAEHQACRIAAA